MLRVETLATASARRYSLPITTNAAPAAALQIKLFGGLEIRRDGEIVPLPQSKKTRALLAYLILKATPQRREALCELFWEIPDDPRAALRWSLSKLRPIVNDETTERLTADRERVAFNRQDVALDFARLEQASANGFEGMSREALLELSEVCSEQLLAGLDLPSQPAYEAWRVGQREKARRLRERLLDALAAGDDADEEPVEQVSQSTLESTALRQDIRFCTSAGGVRIAYATVGSGPPLVKTCNWLNHLEFDWESPIWRHVFRAFGQDHTFIRYDSRGNGLSDWDVSDLSLEARVADLKAVVDAAGVQRFPLFALSQGCAVAVEFAVRYPERVSKLILYGGYARGWRGGGAAMAAQAQALMTLTRTGWGRGNPAYRQLFTSLFIPGAAQEQMDWFNELQRITTSPENAARILDAHGDVDVRDRLALVTQPTLVLHVRNEACVHYANGRQLAAGIPGAKFVTLEGQNHLLLEQEPAWPRFLAEVRAFLAEP